MKRLFLILAASALTVLLCACSSRDRLSQQEAADKLLSFMENFSYSQPKEFDYDSGDTVTVDGILYYSFTVYWVQEANDRSLIGTYLVSSADGTISPA